MTRVSIVCSPAISQRIAPRKRTQQKAVSALPPKADMCSAVADVRFGPIADIASVPARGKASIGLPSRQPERGSW